MNKLKYYAPYWAYDDNPISNYGRLYADMCKSKKFYKVLTPGEQLFLLKCIAHATTKECKECLYKALETRCMELGEEKSKEDIALMTYNTKNRYGHDLFVFPYKHAQKYGYSSASISKYFRILEEKGFIKTIQNGQLQHKVSIYEFVGKWKA